MPDMWERARARHESTPVPEELEFAVASALRAGQRRLRGRRALRRSVSGVLAGCACFVLLVNASPAFARAVSDVPVLGGLARVTERIDNDVPTGAVYIDGKTWSARSSSGESIEPDTMVHVVRMEGVKLYVEAEKEA